MPSAAGGHTLLAEGMNSIVRSDSQTHNLGITWGLESTLRPGEKAARAPLSSGLQLWTGERRSVPETCTQHQEDGFWYAAPRRWSALSSQQAAVVSVAAS